MTNLGQDNSSEMQSIVYCSVALRATNRKQINEGPVSASTQQVSGHELNYTPLDPHPRPAYARLCTQEHPMQAS
jgi:hypothetical protein